MASELAAYIHACCVATAKKLEESQRSRRESVLEHEVEDLRRENELLRNIEF